MKPVRDFFLPIAACGALLFGLAQPAAAVTLVGDNITITYGAPPAASGKSDSFLVGASTERASCPF